MLLEHVARELIDVSNVIDGLIHTPETVKKVKQSSLTTMFNTDFHVAIPANSTYFEFDPATVFQVAPLSVLQLFMVMASKTIKGLWMRFLVSLL